MGKNIIEVFQFSQNNNNDNNNDNALIKKKEININDNNNNDSIINNNINNSDNEIKCITLAKGYIICGHASGLMSVWKPEQPEVYLQKLQCQKLHNDSINKILYAQLSDGNNYLFSCSSDKSIKVYCMELNQVQKTQTFESEVMDIKLVQDFDKKNIFIASLKNGKLIALNEGFDILFEIPSRFSTQTTRYVLSLPNPNQNNQGEDNGMSQEDTNNNIAKGDLLLITEGKLIEVFTWIKEGSFVFRPNKQNNHQKRPNNPFPHNQFYPNFPFRGGYKNYSP